jgi:hypothetical protein
MGTYTSILTTFSDAPSTATPLDAADLNPYTFAVNDLDTRVTTLATEVSALGVMNVTAKKTVNYTASPNDYALFDTTSGSLTLTFPTAPANGTQVGGKQVVRGGTNVVNLQLGGSDHFETTTGSQTGTLTLLDQAGVWQYVSAFAIWVKVSDDLPLGQLDSRYVSSVTNTDGSLTIGGTATAPVVSLGPDAYSEGGPWSASTYNTQFENMGRDDASAGVITTTNKTLLVLLGLVPAGSFSTFKVCVSTASSGTGVTTCALYGSASLTSTAWARLGSGNVTLGATTVGIQSTSLAFTLASSTYVALEMVVTTNYSTTYPTFAACAAVPAALLNPASGCPVLGTSTSTTAPASTLNPTTGFTAGTQKIWCALA